MGTLGAIALIIFGPALCVALITLATNRHRSD